MGLNFASGADGARPLHVVEQDALDAWLSDQPEHVAAWLRAVGFTAALGKAVMVPGKDGQFDRAVVGYGTAAARARGRFHLAAAAASLPAGVYRFEGLPEERAEEEALGWLLAGYVFDRYRGQTGDCGG
jgi:leucyl aminopeptidase